MNNFKNADHDAVEWIISNLFVLVREWIGIASVHALLLHLHRLSAKFNVWKFWTNWFLRIWFFLKVLTFWVICKFWKIWPNCFLRFWIFWKIWKILAYLISGSLVILRMWNYGLICLGEFDYFFWKLEKFENSILIYFLRILKMLNILA